MEEAPKYPQVAAIFSRLLKELDVTSYELAKSIGADTQKFYNYVSGKHKPSYEIFGDIATKYRNVNIKWLLTGLGDPLLDAITEVEVLEDTTPADTTIETEKSLSADANSDPYYHRYHALLDMVNRGFFGTPEELLRKKAKASADAAPLTNTVDAIAAQLLAPWKQVQGFRTAAQRQLTA